MQQIPQPTIRAELNREIKIAGQLACLLQLRRRSSPGLLRFFKDPGFRAKGSGKIKNKKLCDFVISYSL